MLTLLLAGGGGIATWFALNTATAFFQVEGLNLQNAFRLVSRRFQAHIRCHIGEFVLFRGNGHGGFYRVPVSIRSTLSGLSFKLTPPYDTDEAITGQVLLNGHHLVFTCPKNPASFSAILWVTNQHAEKYRVGVFSGTMVDNAPYAGRAIMVPLAEQVSDQIVMELLEQDQITIIDQKALESLGAHIASAKAKGALPIFGLAEEIARLPSPDRS